jgi:hypothetical protein
MSLLTEGSNAFHSNLVAFSVLIVELKRVSKQILDASICSNQMMTRKICILVKSKNGDGQSVQAPSCHSSPLSKLSFELFQEIVTLAGLIVLIDIKVMHANTS